MPDPNKKKGGVGFQASTHPFAYTMVNSPETGDSIYLRTVSPQIPDRILQTGNRRVLENFYFQNREKLTAADKRYLGARLHTAALVDRLEKKALEDLAEGKPRPTPEITTKRGYQGINMKMPRCQSSNNGCWSCGMEMLFRSRGVDITQEEIRAYRPDYPEGQEKMSKERQYAANRDTGASLYDCGDLLLKVLPNACLRCQEFQPLEQPESMSLYDSNGKRVWNEDLQKAAAAQQKQQLLVQKTKQLLQDPRFERTLKDIPQGETREDTILNRQYYIGTGETLLNHYNKAAAPQMIQSAPNA